MTKYLLIFHFQVSLVWSIIKTLYWSSRGGPGDPSPSSAPLRDDTPVSGEMTAPGTGVGAVACEPDQRSARSGVGVLGVPPSTNGDVAGVGGGTGDGGGDTFTTEEEIEMDDNAEILPNGVHYGLTSYTSKSVADFQSSLTKMDWKKFLLTCSHISNRNACSNNSRRLLLWRW